MPKEILRTSIWKNTLDARSHYSKESPIEVDLLRTVFLQARNNAAVISENIKASQPGLTIHDITHIDSLFETADLISTGKIQLNPVEAFVLGGAILFHDLGMALYVWDEKVEEIKQSIEFRDLAVDLLNSRLDRTPTQKEIDKLNDHDIQLLLARVFRMHHADKASSLPAKGWQTNKGEMFIIDNYDLREKLGEKIGIIAQSHWWPVDYLRNYFKEAISPAPTGFNPTWTIDNIKISSLLRIADYIHIDDRRAPSFEFVLNQPGKISRLSNQHWTFQNKLNRPIIHDNRIVYESKAPFAETESDAWWLAYTTITEIHKEINFVNELLQDRCGVQLNCIGVRGASSPLVLAETIKTERWMPVDTEYKISDLLGVIQKLGGQQLYGKKHEVPVKELIQNACDAILARKVFVAELNEELEIRFYIDQEGDEWLEVKDNGLGMSKSVLLHHLLDFGNSYWKSELARTEYKGLRSSSFQSTGKYGIGFFSIFMIAKEVEVISKPLLGGMPHVLSFKNGLASNPVLKEFDYDWFESGTLVKLKLARQQYYGKENFITTLMKRLFFSMALGPEKDPLSVLCAQLAPALPCKLSTSYLGGEKKRVCVGQDWQTIDNLSLLQRIYGVDMDGTNRSGTEYYLKFIAQFVSPIYSIDKKQILARATIVTNNTENTSLFKGIVTAGGLAEGTLTLLPGLWKGANTVVTRTMAVPECSYEELAIWLTEQYQQLVAAKEQFSDIELYRLSNLLFSFGIECRELPIAFTSDGFVSFNDLVVQELPDHVLIRPVIRGAEMEFSPVPGILYSQFYYYESALNDTAMEMVWTKEIEAAFANKGISIFLMHNYRSLFCYTVMAIAESWKLPLKDVVDHSFLSILKWSPIMKVYKNEQGTEIEDLVLVVINPQKISRKEIAKKYENEIKKWIKIKEDGDKEFDVSAFY